MNDIDLQCSASISFDAAECMLRISHADASGVQGELGLYVNRDDLLKLCELCVEAVAAIDDDNDFGIDDGEEIPF